MYIDGSGDRPQVGKWGYEIQWVWGDTLDVCDKGRVKRRVVQDEFNMNFLSSLERYSGAMMLARHCKVSG